MNNLMAINNVRGYLDPTTGTAYLNAEDIARGFGFVEEKGGIEYVKWRRVNAYLHEFGFSPDVAKNDFLPENMVYRLGFKASEDVILIGALAKILHQNGIEIGQKRLFDWLRGHGYLIKSGRDRNMPTQKSRELNLFKIKERAIDNPDGSVRLVRTTLVTGKGQQYFINRFIGQG